MSSGGFGTAFAASACGLLIIVLAELYRIRRAIERIANHGGK